MLRLLMSIPPRRFDSGWGCFWAKFALAAWLSVGPLAACALGQITLILGSPQYGSCGDVLDQWVCRHDKRDNHRHVLGLGRWHGSNKLVSGEPHLFRKWHFFRSGEGIIDCG